MSAHQYEMALPRADRDRDRLAEAVELLNAETDPAERMRLHAEIEALRLKLREAE